MNPQLGRPLFMWLLQATKIRSYVTYKANGTGFNGHVMSKGV